MENRFGIRETLFDDYLLFERKKSWFLIRFSQEIGYASTLKATKVGLRAFQRIGDFVKPTTRFIQTFGRFATRAKFQIDMAQIETLLGGGKIHIDLTLENGYVILTVGENRALGLGLWINGKIRSQLPRKEIRYAMLNIESNKAILRHDQNMEDSTC